MSFILRVTYSGVSGLLIRQTFEAPGLARAHNGRFVR